MTKYTGTDMRISLDTNVWVFGLLEQDSDCMTILRNLDRFQVVVSNQIRKELNSNLTDSAFERFYKVVKQFDIELNIKTNERRLPHHSNRRGAKHPPTPAVCQWAHNRGAGAGVGYSTIGAKVVE